MSDILSVLAIGHIDQIMLMVKMLATPHATVSLSELIFDSNNFLAMMSARAYLPKHQPSCFLSGAYHHISHKVVCPRQESRGLMLW
jgi:hypothetical protein